MSRRSRRRRTQHWRDERRRGGTLYRDPERGLVFGVCYGVARYLGWNPRALRVVTFLACLIAGWPVLVYLAAAYVLPRVDVDQEDVEAEVEAPTATASGVRARFGGLDRRLARIEAYLHSEEYDLRQKFRELEA